MYWIVCGRPFFQADSSPASVAVAAAGVLSTTVALGAELMSSGAWAPAVCCAAAGAIIASQAAIGTAKRSAEVMTYLLLTVAGRESQCCWVVAAAATDSS